MADFTSFNTYLSDPNIEGPSRPILHYTQNMAGESGLTIGRGLDLGKHSKDDLKRMGFSENLRNKLAPYTGLIGKEAKDLDGTDIGLTSTEYNEIIEKTLSYKLSEIERKFNKDSKESVGKFEDLPDPLKYMIGSVYFQMGTSNPKKVAPEFWKQVTEGDWKGLKENMLDFGMKQTIYTEKGDAIEAHWPKGDARREYEWFALEKAGWTVDSLNAHFNNKKDTALLKPDEAIMDTIGNIPQ
jgi:hypothetical protein